MTFYNYLCFPERDVAENVSSDSGEDVSGEKQPNDYEPELTGEDLTDPPENYKEGKIGEISFMI